MIVHTVCLHFANLLFSAVADPRYGSAGEVAPEKVDKMVAELEER